MLWLASFPRSGSTFLRIVLHDVYGIESSTFHLESAYPVDDDYARYPVVKTHLLPHQLVPEDPDIPAVYLVRDGRDCMVSMAHYRKDLVAPRSDLDRNVTEVVEAAGGSHFGGWSEHVRRWRERASLTLRFDDLVSDPIATAERLRPWLDLPEPALDRVPTFDDLRETDHVYGSGASHGFEPGRRERFRKAKFRRGMSGSWQDELPPRHLQRFLELHGDELDRAGFHDDALVPAPHRTVPRASRNGDGRPLRALIDATKLSQPGMDGVKRYVLDLALGMSPLVQDRPEEWDVALCLGERTVVRLPDAARALEEGDPIPHRIPREACVSLQSWRGDLLHLTLPNTWHRFRRVRAPRLTTVHDLSHVVCPELQRHANVATLDEGLRAAMDARSDLLCVSHATLADLRTHFGSRGGRTRVVLEGADPERYRVPTEEEVARARGRYGIPPGPYVFSVGTLEPRKNHLNTVNAFLRLLDGAADLDVRYVIAGGGGWGEVEALLQERLGRRGAHAVRLVGHVDEADLPALYGGATALAYVSRYEGFGLPALEAMRCGTPVVYGATPALRDLVGDAGISADPEDVGAIAAALDRVLRDPAEVTRMRARAVSRAWRLTREGMAKATLEVYRECVAGRGRKPAGGLVRSLRRLLDR